jgi:hypothetical protein
MSCPDSQSKNLIIIFETKGITAKIGSSCCILDQKTLTCLNLLEGSDRLVYFDVHAVSITIL